MSYRAYIKITRLKKHFIPFKYCLTLTFSTNYNLYNMKSIFWQLLNGYDGLEDCN